MTLPDHLAEIADRLRRNEYANEASISGGIVLRVLEALGWPIYDPQVVFREFSVKGRRVDFALCHPTGKPRVFVEVKQPGQARGADQQLFEYAFHDGVPMALMTDGREWHVYVPAGAGSYDERRVYLLDLLERTPEEAAERLRRYLAYDRVRTEEAVRAARDDYDRIARSREGERHLPEAWQRLLADPEADLVALLAEKVEALCGVRPDDARVTAFLQKQNAAPAAPTAPKRLSLAREPATTAAGTYRTVPAPASATASEKTPTAHYPYLILFGERFEGKFAVDVYREFFRRLINRYPNFASEFSVKVKGTKRPYLSKDASLVLPDAPRFWNDSSRIAEMPRGWLLCIHLNNEMKMSLARQACEIAGLRFGTDVVIHF